jgi:alkanesulfonate monooxygenase SsuD/methylene tetrahydromethanopterin reductase-like flavin-dependent oxidoreductase (luciferase family)
MRFGIFDWIDETRPLELSDIYEQRLKVMEIADAAGFWCYHVAEHHFTPLGMAPSPSLLLAAAAQRTHRMRLGPMVFCLPLYNPMRQIEEICMLDHLTGGRLELGVGRGTSLGERTAYNINVENSRPMFDEALQLICRGLATGRVSHHGEYYAYQDVPLSLRPKQQPYPPLWYPTSNPESAPWIAAQGLSILLSATIPSWSTTAEVLATYRRHLEEHRADPGRLNGHVQDPCYGFSRHVYVGEDDASAWREAKVAYEEFDWSYTHRIRQGERDYSDRPSFEGAVEQRRILVGSPATVREQLQELVELTGANYFAGAFAFGNLTLEQTAASLRRFAEAVFPAFASNPALSA